MNLEKSDCDLLHYPCHPPGMLTVGLQHGASCAEKPHSTLLPTVHTTPQERYLKPQMKHSGAHWRLVAPRITACHLHVFEASLPLTTLSTGNCQATPIPQSFFFSRFSLFIKLCSLFKTLIQGKKLQCQLKALLSTVAN